MRFSALLVGLFALAAEAVLSDVHSHKNRHVRTATTATNRNDTTNEGSKCSPGTFGACSATCGVGRRTALNKCNRRKQPHCVCKRIIYTKPCNLRKCPEKPTDTTTPTTTTSSTETSESIPNNATTTVGATTSQKQSKATTVSSKLATTR